MCTVVDVGLNESVYTVMEVQEEIEVCARLTGLIAREVTVRLSTSSGTAEAGSDFTAIMDAARTFMPSLSMVEDVCWLIEIENDNSVEGQELFVVSLSTDDISVFLDPDDAQVFIMEQDCMYFIP